MRTSTRLAWPTLNEPILEPKSFSQEVQSVIESVEPITPVAENNIVKNSSDANQYILTIRLKPEHIWIGILFVIVLFLFYSLSLSWSKIALLEDTLSMK